MCSLSLVSLSLTTECRQCSFLFSHPTSMPTPTMLATSIFNTLAWVRPDPPAPRLPPRCRTRHHQCPDHQAPAGLERHVGVVTPTCAVQAVSYTLHLCAWVCTHSAECAKHTCVPAVLKPAAQHLCLADMSLSHSLSSSQPGSQAAAPVSVLPAVGGSCPAGARGRSSGPQGLSGRRRTPARARGGVQNTPGLAGQVRRSGPSRVPLVMHTTMQRVRKLEVCHVQLSLITQRGHTAQAQSRRGHMVNDPLTSLYSTTQPRTHPPSPLSARLLLCTCPSPAPGRTTLCPLEG